LCGGLIHPVAGRCKHCKEDLSALRAGRPAAAAPLPALQGRSAVPVAVPVAEASQPILPPRPTGSGVAVQAPRSAWKSWPALVIALAAVAIVGAVVIMVWPHHEPGSSHSLAPPPAPERMDTDPLPPPGAGNANGADPWSNNAPHSQVTPRSTPDPLPAQPAQPQDDDQFGFGGITGGTNLGLGGATSPDFMLAALGHACKKLKTCPNADDTLNTLCDTYMAFPQAAPPSTCAEAKRCLDAIDNMSCSQSGYGSPLAVVNMFQDCTKAITSC
jgi:hypothetical protein